MKNKYQINEKDIIVYNRKDNKEMLFDIEDFDFINKHTWHIFNGYAYSNISKINGKKSTINAHRLVMKAPKGLQVDHINGNRLDNRKANLRIVNNQQNQHNKITAKGYNWYKPYNKWRAQIKVGVKVIHLGYYNTEAEARTAYLEAKKKYHPSAPIHLYE